jgi:GH15 family glucan-1,4-alpha-glucosidase
MGRPLECIPYHSIARHGVTGDRRTAALVAADGSVDWLCLPDYDGPTVFGALLDVTRGGFWRLGPSVPFTGSQTYLAHTPAVLTHWQSDTGTLELTDLMAWPDEHRPRDLRNRRVLLRRLRCTKGQMACKSAIFPRDAFGPAPKVEQGKAGLTFTFEGHSLGLWTSFPVAVHPDGATASFHLKAGEEAWAVLALNEPPERWSCKHAQEAYDQTAAYWQRWLGGLTYSGSREKHLKHSGLIIHLLGYAPCGSMVASPTTSLPECIGGSLNWDYRYAWVRDASLSVAGLALLGDKSTATRYLDWVAGLTSSTEMPLQVAYHIDGTSDLREHDRTDLDGYRGSLPVRLGNRAFNQLQLGSLGYLADCTLIYLNLGGKLQPNHWKMIQRIADFIVGHWHEPDSGIWELTTKTQYTVSKVMSWVVLDRALKIADKAGFEADTDGWQKARDAIHEDVMRNAWSEERKSFIQRYGSDALDASVLLIPVMGFLPPDHPKVRQTTDRVAEDLSIDGLIYRFDPMETPVEHPRALGAFEASFLPCTFWLATAYAMAGRVEEADQLLKRAESLAGEMGLFSEEADPRSNELVGNHPLLFSQVEYVRAVLSLDEARSGRRPEHGVGHGTSAQHGSPATEHRTGG